MTPYRDRLEDGEYSSTTTTTVTTSKKQAKKSDTTVDPEPGTATPKDDDE